jgi:hypothetical protein
MLWSPAVKLSSIAKIKNDFFFLFSVFSSFSRTTSIDVGVRKSQSEQNFCRNFQKEKGKEEKAANVIGKSFSEQFLLDTNTKYKRKKRQVKEDDEEEEEEEEGDGKQLLQTLNQNVFAKNWYFMHK